MPDQVIDALGDGQQILTPGHDPWRSTFASRPLLEDLEAEPLFNR